jgi:hypothetical protein
MLPARDFFVLNACLTLVWLMTGMVVVREHRALTEPASALADDVAVGARSVGAS